jgi:hypothetical protein
MNVENQDIISKSNLIIVPKALSDDGKEVFTSVISTEEIDRYYDLVIIDGVDYKAFMNDPQLFYSHNNQSFPIGQVTKIWKAYNPAGIYSLYASWFIDESIPDIITTGIDPNFPTLAAKVKYLLDKGYLRTVSIGFRIKTSSKIPAPDDLKLEIEQNTWTGTIRSIDTSELVELSIVTIPGNANALIVKTIDKLLTKSINILDFKKEIETMETKEEKELEKKSGAAISADNKKSINDMMEKCIDHKSFIKKVAKQHTDVADNIIDKCKSLLGEGTVKEDNKDDSDNDGKSFENPMLQKILNRLDTLSDDFIELKSSVESTNSKTEIVKPKQKSLEELKQIVKK